MKTTYTLVGKSLGAAMHLGRYFHPLRREVYGLEYVDPESLCEDFEEIDIEDSEYTPWPEWFARLCALRPGVTGPGGWGACYGAGMSPEESIACCTHGIGRDDVIRFWTFPNARKFELVFEVSSLP